MLINIFILTYIDIKILTAKQTWKNVCACGIAETECDFIFFDKALVMRFASPVVWGKCYNEACYTLEKQERLHHNWISNESSLIHQTLSISCTEWCEFVSLEEFF